MKKDLLFPTQYTALTNEEMTYTEGGSAFGAAAMVVGTAVLASSYVWGIGQAREWLSIKKNREGNFLTVLGRATDDLSADMSKSASNFLRDGVSAAMVVSLAPLSAILLIL